MRSGFRVQTSLQREALAYVERGWPVLPLVPHEKRPLTGNGLLDASVDPAVVTAWWTRWPSANIGLRTGVQFDVLDIDGDVGTASLEAKVGPEYRHSGPISRTGRGEHWLFLPGKTANRAGLLDKLDWRGTNGYIVAPPSVHPDGRKYYWHTPPSTTLPPIPDWLLPLLVPFIERAEFVSVKASPTSFGILEMAMALKMHPRADGGGRYNVECVFHDGDREPSLVLYPDDNHFHCYGCGAHGTMYDLHRVVKRV
jgi:hypothetical protein